jgi:hypothetical protein
MEESLWRRKKLSFLCQISSCCQGSILFPNLCFMCLYTFTLKSQIPNNDVSPSGIQDRDLCFYRFNAWTQIPNLRQNLSKIGSASTEKCKEYRNFVVRYRMLCVSQPRSQMCIIDYIFLLNFECGYVYQKIIFPLKNPIFRIPVLDKNRTTTLGLKNVHDCRASVWKNKTPWQGMIKYFHFPCAYFMWYVMLVWTELTDESESKK